MNEIISSNAKLIKRTLFISASFCFALSSIAQDQIKDNSFTFRRSSLYTFIIKSDKDSIKMDKKLDSSGNVFTDVIAQTQADKKQTTADDSIPKIDLIVREFTEIPIPPQFDSLCLETRVVDFDQYPVTLEEVEAINATTTGEKKKKGFGKLVKSVGSVAASTLTAGSLEIDTMNIKTYLPAVIDKYFKQNEVPSMLLCKWFNYSDEAKEIRPNYMSHYNMELIKERGKQSTTAEEIDIAQNAERGEAFLKDAGKDLLSNTFVMAIYLQYLSKEELMKQVQDGLTVATGIAGAFGVNTDLMLWGTQAAGAVAGATMGSGYFVQATSYLYRLNCNEEKTLQFYKELYDKPLEDLIKSGICQLEFIGKDKAYSGVRASRFSKRPESELLNRATARAIDAAIAKLQKEHDEFKTKTPVVKIDEKEGLLYASIGLREGVEAGDVYTVLQPIVDPVSYEITDFEAIGKVKAVKDQIYDNRYQADIEREEDAENGQATENSLKYTAFKGKVKQEWQGCLLKLEKKK